MQEVVGQEGHKQGNPNIRSSEHQICKGKDILNEAVDRSKDREVNRGQDVNMSQDDISTFSRKISQHTLNICRKQNNNNIPSSLENVGMLTFDEGSSSYKATKHNIVRSIKRYLRSSTKFTTPSIKTISAPPSSKASFLI